MASSELVVGAVDAEGAAPVLAAPASAAAASSHTVASFAAPPAAIPSPSPEPADSYKPRAILLTGGAGFIGSNVLLHLAREYPSYTLVCLDKLDVCSSLENLRPLFSHPRFHFVRGDICNASLVRRVCLSHDVDTIMHFASQTHVDNSFGNSLAFTYANVQGTHTMLECALSLGKQIRRFIHVSTDEVYGGQEDGHAAGAFSPVNGVGVSLHAATDSAPAPPSHTPQPAFRESSPLNPTNPYAATKAAAEFLVRSYRLSFSLPTIITRGNNVYGPRQYPEKLVAKFTSLLSRGRACPLHGHGKNRRSFLYVDDVARAFDTILHRGEVGSIYNIGTEEEVENREILARLIRIFRTHYPECLDSSLPDSAYVMHVRDRAFNDFRYHIDSSAVAALGWKPQQLDLDQGLLQTVQWYMAHPHHWTNVEAALEPHPYLLVQETGNFGEEEHAAGAATGGAGAAGSHASHGHSSLLPLSPSVAVPLRRNSTATAAARMAAAAAGSTSPSFGSLPLGDGSEGGALISALRRWSFSRGPVGASTGDAAAAAASAAAAVASSSQDTLASPAVIYENQRRLLFKWRAPSLPTDRYEFTDATGAVRLATPVQRGSAAATVPGASLPYEVWVQPGRTDADGWMYAVHFSAQYYPNAFLSAFVRRRQWRRIDTALDTRSTCTSPADT